MKHYTEEKRETISDMYAWRFLSLFADYCKERGYEITFNSGAIVKGNIDGLEFTMHQFKHDTQYLRFSIEKKTLSVFDHYVLLDTQMISFFSVIEFFKGMSYNSIKTYQLFIPWQERCEHRILKRAS